MIGARVLTAMAAGVTLGGITLAGWLVVAGPEGVDAVPDLAIAPAPEVPASRRLAPDSLAALAQARDPFRSSRDPAQIPFDPTVAAEAAFAPPRPSLPPLTLVGIALGAERAALIDGLPGSETTRVLRVGESVAGYTVLRIEETTVRIAGPDTTWTLRVRGNSP